MIYFKLCIFFQLYHITKYIVLNDLVKILALEMESGISQNYMLIILF